MTTEPLALFANHSRCWRNNHFVYPVLSRRSRGLSIGINLNPDKVCNFDCVYCSVDRTASATDRTASATAREVDLDVLRLELREMLALTKSGEIFQSAPFNTTPPELRRLSDVAFSGDGEPTSYACLANACRLAAAEIGAAGATDTKLVLITNATLLSRPVVLEALAVLDAHNGEVWAKLDAGTEAYYRQIDRSAVPLTRILNNIRDCGRARSIVIQSLFMCLHGTPPPESEIKAYLTRLHDLHSGGCQISRVQIYTTARQPAEPWVTPLHDDQIDALAALVANQGLAVEAYYGVQSPSA